jgi:hypothetical protein
MSSALAGAVAYNGSSLDPRAAAADPEATSTDIGSSPRSCRWPGAFSVLRWVPPSAIMISPRRDVLAWRHIHALRRVALADRDLHF